MTLLSLYLPDSGATEVFGERLAACAPPGSVLFLFGELGAGKTTLVRGFLRGLGHAGAVRSPTYTLVEPYEVGDGAVYHFDLYRLADPEELDFIGIREFFGDHSRVLVEWPERGYGMLPSPDLELRLEHLPEGRLLHATASGTHGKAILSCLSSG